MEFRIQPTLEWILHSGVKRRSQMSLANTI